MKIKKSIILLTFLLFCYLVPTLAQEINLKYLGVEAGITNIKTNIHNIDYLRGYEPSYYSVSRSASSINSSMYLAHFGLKPEFFFLNNKLGILTGLEYSRIGCSIKKNENETSNTSYFYFLYHQDAVNTEYLRIKEISEKSDCLGIPIEIRYFLFHPNLVRFYVKLGVELIYRLQTKTDVVFFDNTMETYQQRVIDMYDKSETFSSLFNFGGGVRIGKISNPAFNVEAKLFSGFITSKPSRFVDPLSGAGFQIEIQVPLKSKSKSKSK